MRAFPVIWEGVELGPLSYKEDAQVTQWLLCTRDVLLSLSVSFFMCFPFFQSEVNRRTAWGPWQAKPLHKSTCKTVPACEPPVPSPEPAAVPAAQLSSDSLSRLSRWSSLLFSGIAAGLCCLRSHHQSPSRCSFPSLLAGVGKGHWHGKAGRERSVVISDRSPLPLFCTGSGHSGPQGELCVWDQAVNLPVLLYTHVSDRGVSVSKIRISYKVCESKCLSGGKWYVHREETVSLCYTDIRVAKGKWCWKPCSWELLSERNHSHLGKRRIFLMTCLFSSAFIYNIDYSSYFWFGVAKWQRWKHRFSMLFKTNL